MTAGGRRQDRIIKVAYFELQGEEPNRGKFGAYGLEELESIPFPFPDQRPFADYRWYALRSEKKPVAYIFSKEPLPFKSMGHVRFWLRAFFGVPLDRPFYKVILRGQNMRTLPTGEPFDGGTHVIRLTEAEIQAISIRSRTTKETWTIRLG